MLYFNSALEMKQKHLEGEEEVKDNLKYKN